MKYDAILITSFGGPESPADVMPFLENVLRGKNVPRERMLEVAEHYYHFGGKSPINDQNRQLIAALQEELTQHGPHLPIYWGNRNWHPMLTDTMRKMQADGVHRALAFVTSAYSSYSSCRQYREDIARAQEAVGEGAPAVDKIRVFHNHPGFIEAVADRVKDALETIPQDRREAAHLIYTAHSIPMAMAQSCDYETQLRETCRLVTEKLGRRGWRLVYQSRSGPPSQPWLEPDILACLREIKGHGGSADVVISPIGFVSDHMEILFDLDTEAAELCVELGMHMVRAGTVGTHPRFMKMIREMICERMDENRGTGGPGGAWRAAGFLSRRLLPNAKAAGSRGCFTRRSRPCRETFMTLLSMILIASTMISTLSIGEPGTESGSSPSRSPSRARGRQRRRSQFRIGARRNGRR